MSKTFSSPVAVAGVGHPLQENRVVGCGVTEAVLLEPTLVADCATTNASVRAIKLPNKKLIVEIEAKFFLFCSSSPFNSIQFKQSESSITITIRISGIRNQIRIRTNRASARVVNAFSVNHTVAE